MAKGVALFALFLLVLNTCVVLALPGDVDTTFNSPNGFVYYNGINNFEDYGFGVAIQSDGKIVVVGLNSNGLDDDILVLRYNPDGTRDNTFGNNGVVTYDVANENDQGFKLVIQTDGKIVVVGRTWDAINGWYVLILKFNSSGVLDNTFGNNGVVTYNAPYNSDYSSLASALQNDDKIVIVGSVFNGVNHDVIILRYNPDGTLDNSFGYNGAVIYDHPGYPDLEGKAVAIQPDGKIICKS